MSELSIKNIELLIRNIDKDYFSLLKNFLGLFKYHDRFSYVPSDISNLLLMKCTTVPHWNFNNPH